MDKPFEPTALISNMQHFSTGDGPGIRSTIFFQGCSLHCDWCHNPETIPQQPILLFYQQRCTSCGQCVKACPFGAHSLRDGKHVFLRDQCRSCGDCVQVCPADALNLSGIRKTAQDVLDFIFEDLVFYQASGGGVTLSGGEPLLQADFCAYIARRCQEKSVSVIIDTAGQVAYSAFTKVLPFTDHFYFDLKADNQAAYRDKTGGDLLLIAGNLTRLIKDGARVTVRIPIIPGHNDNTASCRNFRPLLREAGVRSVHLLPFHRLGSSKYVATGSSYKYRDSVPPDREKMFELLQLFTPEFDAKIEW